MNQEFFDIRTAYRDFESERAARMNELLEVSRTMNATLDEDVLLPFLMDRVVDLMEADRGHLVLLRLSQDHVDGRATENAEDGEPFPWDIKFSLLRGREGQDSDKHEGLLSKTIIRRVIEERQPLLVEDASQDISLNKSQSIHELGLQSVMATPLISRNRVIGVLSVENRAAVGVFNDEDMDFLQIFGSQAAVAIENAQLYLNLKQTQGQLAKAHKALKLEVVESQEALLHERRKAEDLAVQVQHQNKMAAMGMMVSSIAHELNNPLTGALGFAELLSRGTNLTDQQRTRLGHISSEMERCAEIVRNLLKFSRKTKEKRDVVSILGTLKEAVELRRYQFEVNNVLVQESYPEEEVQVLADAYQLKGVFINLLANAFDAICSHNPSGGTICVNVLPKGRFVTVEITDTGGGIKALDKIFDPFYTTKEVGKGTGLGLSVAYGVIHGHGGKISAQNTEDGAQLSIRLPISQKKAVAPNPVVVPSKAVKLRKSHLNILVVDDEMVVRDLCKAILEGEGHTVHIAENGAAGQEKLRANQYDLLVSDIRMPGGMSGLDLYRWIEQELPSMCSRVLFITGDLMTPALRGVMDSVGQRVMTKPFEVDAFLAAVLETVGSAEQSDLA